MKLNQALKNIKYFDERFAKAEVLCIREHKEESIPVLLEFLSDCIDLYINAVEWSDDLVYPMYTMFPLAEFGVNEAFNSFIRILELDEEHCDWILGDCLTEDMGSLLGSIAVAENIDRIKTVVENTALDDFQRLAALRALSVLYVRDLYSREEISAYFGQLLSTFEDDCTFLTFVACECDDLVLEEHYSNIVALFEANKIDEFIIEKNDFTSSPYKLSKGEKVKDPHIRSSFNVVTNTVESMQTWACFNSYPVRKPVNQTFSATPIVKQPKISRNAPCPCNSGKKYKHCCLKNLE